MSSDLSKTTKAESPVGIRLVEAFKKRGITSKRDISESLGFKSENAIYKVLSGDRELSFDSLRRFAQTTGQSINWLLTGTETPETLGNRDHDGLESTEVSSNQSSKDILEELFSAVNIGPRLRQIFPGKSITQIAEDLGVPEPTVESYLHGHLPAVKVLEKIAEKTGVSPIWLLTNRGSQWAAPTARLGGEKERVSEEKERSSLPRTEAVRLGPEKPRETDDPMLMAYLQLLVEQNHRIIRLLGEIAEKVG